MSQQTVLKLSSETCMLSYTADSCSTTKPGGLEQCEKLNTAAIVKKMTHDYPNVQVTSIVFQVYKTFCASR